MPDITEIEKKTTHARETIATALSKAPESEASPARAALEELANEVVLQAQTAAGAEDVRERLNEAQEMNRRQGAELETLREGVERIRDASDGTNRGRGTQEVRHGGGRG